MQDTELYNQLLGLQLPWSVTHVHLNPAEERVDVYADHESGVRFACPECAAELPVYDHAETRQWRHLDSCQFHTYLHARIPRVACRTHGVRQVQIPWAEPHARFTLAFERLAIGVLLETDVLGGTRILHISWDEAWHIMERAVARGQGAKKKRVLAHLGVDEKAVGHGHTYFTLVNDIDQGTVEYIADDRTKESLDGFYQTLTSHQLQGIQAVAMDMWSPYLRSTREHVPDADDKIVFDRYHIMRHMNEAVDAVRKQEQRRLRATGADVLSGTKYLWLYAEERLPKKHRARFAVLKARHLKTGRAWAIKETLRELWRYVRHGWALRHWKQWYFWASHSRLKPITKVAELIKRHLRNVMTYFDHRITNAVSEGLNSKIQALKHNAYGFRNREHFKTAIYFHCGGLKLYPTTHGIPG